MDEGGDGMGPLGWIIFGALAGWLAAVIMKEDQGCLTNVIVGIFGALLGGFLFAGFGKRTIFEFDLWSFFVAVMGAILLIAIRQAFRGREP
jgi:uncharacterized membrane protein YeaQ/YmgE (transglycosylase-associated protein family)